MRRDEGGGRSLLARCGWAPRDFSLHRDNLEDEISRTHATGELSYLWMGLGENIGKKNRTKYHREVVKARNALVNALSSARMMSGPDDCPKAAIRRP